MREVTRHICHSLDGHVEFSLLMLPSVARYGRYSSLFTRYSILKFRSEKRLSMKGGGRISLLTSTSFNNRSFFIYSLLSSFPLRPSAFTSPTSDESGKGGWRKRDYMVQH